MLVTSSLELMLASTYKFTLDILPLLRWWEGVEVQQLTKMKRILILFGLCILLLLLVGCETGTTRALRYERYCNYLEMESTDSGFIPVNHFNCMDDRGFKYSISVKQFESKLLMDRVK